MRGAYKFTTREVWYYLPRVANLHQDQVLLPTIRDQCTYSEIGCLVINAHIHRTSEAGQSSHKLTLTDLTCPWRCAYQCRVFKKRWWHTNWDAYNFWGGYQSSPTPSVKKVRPKLEILVSKVLWLLKSSNSASTAAGRGDGVGCIVYAGDIITQQ